MRTRQRYVRLANVALRADQQPFSRTDVVDTKSRPHLVAQSVMRGVLICVVDYEAEASLEHLMARQQVEVSHVGQLAGIVHVPHWLRTDSASY